jgi:hypothetical protein
MIDYAKNIHNDRNIPSGKALDTLCNGDAKEVKLNVSRLCAMAVIFTSVNALFGNLVTSIIQGK